MRQALRAGVAPGCVAHEDVAQERVAQNRVAYWRLQRHSRRLRRACP